MKRSEIDNSIDGAIAFYKKMNFPLPRWATRSPDEWRQAVKSGEDCSGIFDTRLGWDVTDFGSGESLKVGRTIFTLRNGSVKMKDIHPKSYAQKAMFMLEGQKSPVHFHRGKREDIINRGGGVVAIKLWKSAPDNSLSMERLKVEIDGIGKTLQAGGEIHLLPGESVCVEPHTYHQFWALEGHGTTLTEEVSSVCDDLSDNFWLDKQERFPPIEENAPARFVLCCEYESLFPH